FTTATHEVAPEIREFERASTTVANAYIKPLAHQYLGRMARQLAEQRIPAPLLLMLSSGGLTHVAEAQRTPVQMLESGPAAGAIAAAFFGVEDGGGELLAFDMGGTTAQLSPVVRGEPRTAYSFVAAPARAAGARLADTVKLPLIGVAGGIHDIGDESMASAARVHVAGRGRDPRDAALLCAGGAGPVHACHVARKLGVREVICPPS